MFITAFYLYVAGNYGLGVAIGPIIGTVLVDLVFLSVLKTAIEGRYGMYDTSDADASEDDDELVDDEWDDPV